MKKKKQKWKKLKFSLSEKLGRVVAMPCLPSHTARLGKVSMVQHIIALAEHRANFVTIGIAHE